MPAPTLPVIQDDSGQAHTKPVQLVDDDGNTLHPRAPLALPATVAAAIAAAGSLSGAVDLGADNRLVGLQVGAAWTAAVITLQGSNDGVTYADVYNSAGELSLPAAANRLLLVDQNLLAGVRYLKVRSGTGAAPVAQVAAAAITVLRAPR